MSSIAAARLWLSAPGRMAPDSTSALAASSISAASRSSSTRAWGAMPASSGKRPSSDWQKAWMVWIFMPPGASRTRAKSRRARAISGWSGARPSRSERSSDSSSAA